MLIPVSKSILGSVLVWSISGCTDIAAPILGKPHLPSLEVPEAPPATGFCPSTRAIYIANADGSGITRLITGEWPAWSDNGRIAFHRDCRIYTINANGTDQTPLVEGAFPSWSPDGTRIAFANRYGISVMNADGSGVTGLVRHDFRRSERTGDDWGVGKPAWSPDGKQIAFEYGGDWNMEPSQIYLINADGTALRRLDAPDRLRNSETDPSWSADGSQLLFWSYRYGITSADPSTGERTSLLPGFWYKPVWSPDRKVIAMTGSGGIWTVSEGRAARLLFRDGFDAAWSPDGRIAFVRNH